MNLISAVLLLAAAAAPLAVLSAWVVSRRDQRAGTLVHFGGTDGWWRDTMPWPQGVQEDDDVHWNFGPPSQPDQRQPGGVNVDLVRVRPGVRRFGR